MTTRLKTALHLVAASVLLSLNGCSSGPSGAGDSGQAPDSGCTPTPVGACSPNSCSTGNSKNVGAYCTKGGGQCNQYSSGVACAIDLSSSGANFCILIGCHQNSDCAEQACCTGDPNGPPIYACVPLTCLADAGDPCPPPPSRGDAGSPDGGDGG